MQAITIAVAFSQVWVLLVENLKAASHLKP